MRTNVGSAGTLTFLFTDVGRSTRLWEEQPAAMEAALARHDELVQAAIERGEGEVFSVAGDSFAAASRRRWQRYARPARFSGRSTVSRGLSNPRLRHNLPIQTSSFVGREWELSELRRLMKDHRLVTLTGVGGGGQDAIGAPARG